MNYLNPKQRSYLELIYSYLIDEDIQINLLHLPEFEYTVYDLNEIQSILQRVLRENGYRNEYKEVLNKYAQLYKDIIKIKKRLTKQSWTGDSTTISYDYDNTVISGSNASSVSGYVRNYLNP